jgi:peroxiredoxin (alkyl hydroperoxide reductase subunit C)
MSISIGQRVPSTELEAYVPGEPDAHRISLADYRGGWVVLVFYPRDFTFICPTELHAFAELTPAFAAEGASVVAVSTDSFWTHRAWFQSHPALEQVGYPVLADTAHTLSREFDVLVEADGSALRGTFVVDPEGVVRHLAISDQSVGRNPEETLRVVQALQTGELCPVNWHPGERTLVAA